MAMRFRFILDSTRMVQYHVHVYRPMCVDIQHLSLYSGREGRERSVHIGILLAFRVDRVAYYSRFSRWVLYVQAWTGNREHGEE